MLSQNQKLLLILGVALFCTMLMFFIGRIKQDDAYHQFADFRVLLQIPNFLNVVTNVPFIVVGLAGMRLCINEKVTLPYQLFFVSVLLTGMGSAYYHLWPENFTLVWDRLPLVMLIISLFCAVVSDCISKKIGSFLLMPLMAMAIAAVYYWYSSELQGQGDLRPYVLMQFLPIILMPLIIGLYEGNQKGCAYVWQLFSLYAVAKVAEALDSVIYDLLHIISGHSLKHLLAGLGTYLVYNAINQRYENQSESTGFC